MLRVIVKVDLLFAKSITYQLMHLIVRPLVICTVKYKQCCITIIPQISEKAERVSYTFRKNKSLSNFLKIKSSTYSWYFVTVDFTVR